MARHYGAIVQPCPPRRGNRKGAAENSVKFVCPRWWRTMTATTMHDAQVSLDRFCVTVGDARPRGETTVGALGDAEPLLALPAAGYPAVVQVLRTVGDNATVAFAATATRCRPG
ncbi:MAG: hypothetical protein ACRDZ4_14080 [Egibacteraceae bacterium]